MISLLYPWMYFDMAQEPPGGGGEGEGEGEGGGGGGGEDDERAFDDIQTPDDYFIAPQVTVGSVVEEKIISGSKLLSGFKIDSSKSNPLINETGEGKIASDGFIGIAHVIGSPGARFYLNIKDIDDDEILDLSNIEIPAIGKYTFDITFPKSNTVNKYKINLRVGDGTRINSNLPTADPMWIIHQLPDPVLTFTKATGTAAGVTYSGNDITFTARARRGLKPQRFHNFGYTPTFKTFGEFDYVVTAAKSGSLVYIKTLLFDFINSTIVGKKIAEDKIGRSNIVKLENIEDLSLGMTIKFDPFLKTKLYSINSTTLKLSDTNNLEPGMRIQGEGTSSEITIISVEENNIIIVSAPIIIRDSKTLEFYDANVSKVNIKNIDAKSKEVTLSAKIARVKRGILLNFRDDGMQIIHSKSVSGSGSALVTLTNDIKIHRFGTNNLTFTLPTDDIFTLTPNASDQNVTVIKETATDINVLLSDSDANYGSKTPSTVKSPVHGVITGSYGSGDGTITYTPAIGFVGEDSFTFKVNDGTTDSEVKTIFITVKK